MFIIKAGILKKKEVRLWTSSIDLTSTVSYILLGISQLSKDAYFIVKIRFIEHLNRDIPVIRLWHMKRKRSNILEVCDLDLLDQSVLKGL